MPGRSPEGTREGHTPQRLAGTRLCRDQPAAFSHSGGRKRQPGLKVSTAQRASVSLSMKWGQQGWPAGYWRGKERACLFGKRVLSPKLEPDLRPRACRTVGSAGDYGCVPWAGTEGRIYSSLCLLGEKKAWRDVGERKGWLPQTLPHAPQKKRQTLQLGWQGPPSRHFLPPGAVRRMSC